MHIEARLIEKVGDLGKKLHTGRSRNDQVTLDMRLYLKKVLAEIDLRIEQLLAAIIDKADAEKTTMMPGYTHTQRAQVVTFSHYLLAYFYMLKRDRERMKQALGRIDALPLGSGALAGSTERCCRSGWGFRSWWKTAWMLCQTGISCWTRFFL
jgi:argininosuccinate lyase